MTCKLIEYAQAVFTSDGPNKLRHVEKWKGRTASYDWERDGDDLTLVRND
jgi:hypothetical protein